MTSRGTITFTDPNTQEWTMNDYGGPLGLSKITELHGTAKRIAGAPLR